MKTVRVLGIIASVGLAVGGVLEYFLRDEISLDTLQSGYKAISLCFVVLCAVGFAITFLTMLFNKKLFSIFGLVIVAAAVIVAILYMVKFYSSVSDAIYPIVAIACGGIALIMMMVTLFNKAKPQNKAKKSKEKPNDNVNVNAFQEQNVVVSQPNVNATAFEPGQDVSGNTISERERILRLKEELNGLDFSKIAEEDANGTLEIREKTEQIDNNDSSTIENTAELRAAIAREEAELQQQVSQLEKATAAKQDAPLTSQLQGTSVKEQQLGGPVDPYKQTILPRSRRLKGDGTKYSAPIGNTPDKISYHNQQRSVKKEVKLDEYRDKVFLGDSDRIWEAMKKQDRSLLQRQKEWASQPDNKTVNARKAKTVELAPKTITKTQEIPTIDWDDE